MLTFFTALCVPPWMVADRLAPSVVLLRMVYITGCPMFPLRWCALCERKGDSCDRAMVHVCAASLFTPLIDSGLHQRGLHSL